MPTTKLLFHEFRGLLAPLQPRHGRLPARIAPSEPRAGCGTCPVGDCASRSILGLAGIYEPGHTKVSAAVLQEWRARQTEAVR